VTLLVVINPLVNWIWMGFGVLAFGTIIALLPERAFTFAGARLPATAETTAATTTLVLVIAGLLLAPGMVSTARAQSQGQGQGPSKHVEGASGAYLVPKTPFEREMQHEIICMCGTCGRRRIGECTCPLAAEMREEVAKLVAQGKSREDIYAYFIAKWGSEEPLAAPIDKTFNRTAWALYGVGSLSAVGALVLARRWSSHKHAAAADGRVATGAGAQAAARDSQLEERLADELRDLD
jgi:cytochrome c-type biogenesis protein CcmH/NrfF